MVWCGVGKVRIGIVKVMVIKKVKVTIKVNAIIRFYIKGMTKVKVTVKVNVITKANVMTNDKVITKVHVKVLDKIQP